MVLEDGARAEPGGAEAVDPPPYRMHPSEVAYGWVYGTSTRRFPSGVFGDPLTALQDVIRPALLRPPCVVTFSGGRDSSAVLAAAVGLARREGHAEPVALTHVYPGDANAEESAWQELVIGHLGVRDWERVEITDEKEFIGPVAAPALLRTGLVFPPGAYSDGPLYERVRGGSILTGELGDEVFGAHRVTAWHRLRGRGVLRPSRWPAAARSVAPRAVRYRRGRAEAAAMPHPWLRPQVDEERIRLFATDMAVAPLDWRTAVFRTIDRRAIRVGTATMQRVAAAHDARLTHPLMDDEFVARYAARAGRIGFPSRATAMMSVFAELLPDAALRRVSKAYFNASRFGPHARAFATSWDGSGVDYDLVDPERLRAEWLADEPHGGTGSLLEQAWLAGHCARRPEAST